MTIVGNKCASTESCFNHGMPPLAYGDGETGIDLGADEVIRVSCLGKRDQDIERSQGLADLFHLLVVDGHPVSHLGKKSGLQLEDFFFRAEDPGLVVLQLRSEVPLAVNDRLLAYVIRGDRLKVGVGPP